MATVRLDAFSHDTIVLHFGGPEGTIDAYTLANALIGFADTAYAVNAAIDPGQEIEIIVEATGPGSYRTVLRKLKKGFTGGVLSGIAGTILWNVVSNVIYDATLKGADPKPQITINTTEVIIKHGNDTIIVPRVVHDATENVKKNPAVREGVRKTFDTLEADQCAAQSIGKGCLRPPCILESTELARSLACSLDPRPRQRLECRHPCSRRLLSPSSSDLWLRRQYDRRPSTGRLHSSLEEIV